MSGWESSGSGSGRQWAAVRVPASAGGAMAGASGPKPPRLALPQRTIMMLASQPSPPTPLSGRLRGGSSRGPLANAGGPGTRPPAFGSLAGRQGRPGAAARSRKRLERPRPGRPPGHHLRAGGPGAGRRRRAHWQAAASHGASASCMSSELGALCGVWVAAASYLILVDAH